MRMRNRMSLSAILICLAACSDSTSLKLQPTRVYELVSIDGNALPALMGAIPVQLADSGSITLDSTGNSRTVTHIRQDSNRFGPPEYDNVQATPYLIHGDSIFLRFPEQCQGECIPDRAGIFTDSMLTIPNASFPLEGRVYRYKRVTD